MLKSFRLLSVFMLLTLAGCSDVSVSDDKIIGTLCILNDRLADIETKLSIDVPKDKRMKCENFNPYGRVTPIPAR